MTSVKLINHSSSTADWNNFLFLRSWKYIPTAVSHPENPNKIDEYFRG